jgi:hypothetical protein
VIKSKGEVLDAETNLFHMFSNHSENTQEWVWVVWINELLLGLNKLHAKHFKVSFLPFLF